jgi:serine protease inhibitor
MHLREKEHKTFHGTNGDKQVTMLEKSINCGEYYKGNHYKAVEVSLMHGTSFWLFLPDKGYTLSNVFKDDTYVDIMRGKAKPARKGGDITIRFPQMDESTSLDAQRALRKLGVAKAFSLEGQYEILADERVKMAGITGIVHATRIMVDKEGITAASFANAMLAGAAQTKWEMTFNCNRPFAYAVADEKGLVYYLGTVQEAPKAPEAKNPPRSIMVDGQVYQEYEMERYMDDNHVDGTITDSVSSDKLPTKDNQSNFGTGYTYQKHDDWCVDVCVDGRWISFIVGE